MGGRSAQQD
uniref:Uncharacterized protein n=1 Tax=Arundo donax TaxID=35708 RepID=A0A0A8ZY77_ARUDO